MNASSHNPDRPAGWDDFNEFAGFEEKEVGKVKMVEVSKGP
jgi:hypothetical protein